MLAVTILQTKDTAVYCPVQHVPYHVPITYLLTAFISGGGVAQRDTKYRQKAMFLHGSDIVRRRFYI